LRTPLNSLEIHVRQMRLISFLLAVSLVFAACSASTRTVTSTTAAKYQGDGFNNILVIGVANDYNSRSRFERILVTKLAEHNVTAVAYYRAMGGSDPIERESVKQLVESEGFDAVLITRVLNQNVDAKSKSGSAATKSVRKDEGALHLFRYDYEDLNEPPNFSFDVSVKLSTEVFDTSSESLVWAIEADISRKEVVSQVVDEAVKIIIQRLQKDGVID
jgi:hypothetical protein